MFDMNSTGWNLDGATVEGRYMGSVPVSGVVINSRPKYGTSIQYTVVLNEGFIRSGGIERKAGETVFLTEYDIDVVIHA